MALVPQGLLEVAGAQAEGPHAVGVQDGAQDAAEAPPGVRPLDVLPEAWDEHVRLRRSGSSM